MLSDVDVDVTFAVCRPSGQVERFSLKAPSPCAELKRRIEASTGVPVQCQQVVVGQQVLEDTQLLPTARDDSEVEVVLVVMMPVPQEKIVKRWSCINQSADLLEELEVFLERPGHAWPPPLTFHAHFDEADTWLVPDARLGCIGLDPDSGLLVVAGGGFEGKVLGKGEDEGEGEGEVGDEEEGDECEGSGEVSEDDAKGKGQGKGKAGDEEGEGKGRGEVGDDDESGGKGECQIAGAGNRKGKGGQDDKGKGKSKGKSKGFCSKGKGIGVGPFRTGRSMLVLPAEQHDPWSLALGMLHPLRGAVEMHVLGWLQGYPLPSLGVGVALVMEGHADISAPLRLGTFELCPVAVKWRYLSKRGVDCEAVCLDRERRIVISVELRAGRRYVLFRRLRAPQGAAREDGFCLSRASGGRVTSLAWSAATSAVLVTVAGEHAVRVYRHDGTSWNQVQTLGDPCKRGCQDGPSADLLFWFPTLERFVLFAGGCLGKDSCPLVPGPRGEVYVYSGGTLMRLASDLSSALKVTSMRQELWMTEHDEGTPEFPASCNVFGVCEGRVYKALVRTDYRGHILVRRLQVSNELRRPRSSIRAVAPNLWPNIIEDRVYDAADATPNQISRRGLRPAFYHEEDRDRWDGNPRWLTQKWLWEPVPGGPADVRALADGSGLVDFSLWLRRNVEYQEYVQWEADEALLARKDSLPAEVTHTASTLCG